MTGDERKALEDAGYAIGDAEDFLGLDDGERRAVDLKVFIARLPDDERAAIERRAAELIAEERRAGIEELDREHRNRQLAIAFLHGFSWGGILTATFYLMMFQQKG